MPSELGIDRNPFHVLDVPITASRAEIERAAQKLLAMLEIGVGSAAEHPSPLGPRPRTADLVRQSVADLRDPAKRIRAELCHAPAGAAPEAAPELPPFVGGRAAMWRIPSVPELPWSGARLDGWSGPVLLVRGAMFLAAGVAALAGEIDLSRPGDVLTLYLPYAVFLFPGILVRAVTVPLGWTRLTQVLSRVFARTPFHPLGGALLDATRALARKRPEAKGAAAERLRDALGALRDTADLTVRAALAVAMGDVDGARRWFTLLDVFEGRGWWNRRRARAWRVGDAAERGDWAAVRRLSEAPGGSPRVWAVGSALARARGEPDAASAAVVWAWWGLGGGGLVLARWIRDTLARPPRAARAHAPEPTGAPMPDALARLAWLQTIPPAELGMVDLVAVAEAWDRARPAVLAHAGRRVAGLEARATPEELVADVEAGVEEALLAALRRADELDVSASGPADAAPAALPPLVTRALDRAFEERFAVAEAALRAALVPRFGEDLQWESWYHLREAWLAAARVAHPERKADLWRSLWPGTCNFAVRADNQLHLRPFSHQVFRFLVEHAPGPDEHGVALLLENVRVTTG